MGPVRESICLVALTNAVSGTERIVASLAAELQRRGISVGVILPRTEALVSLGLQVAATVDRVAHIGDVTGRNTVGRSALEAFRVFRRWKPTVVHVHCPYHRWGLGVVLAARLAGVPRVIRTEHNPLMAAPGVLPGGLLRLADRGVSAFTYVSAGNRDRFERLLPYRTSRGHVVWNAVSSREFKPSDDGQATASLMEEFGFPQGCRVAIYVGSFGHRRSIHQIVAAFRNLLNGDSAELARTWRLLVVGTGPEEERQLPARFGIAGYVRFAGQRTDVAALLPNCDLFVTSSHFEGMSLSILEAWSAGLPVLATRVDGLSDVIGEEDSKRLTVNQGDADAYANAWLAFMKDPSDLLLAANKARRFIRTELTLPKMVDRYLQLYQSR